MKNRQEIYCKSSLPIRKREMDQLRRALAEAKNSKGKLVILNGEQGSGKSTLIKCLKDESNAQEIDFQKVTFDISSGFDPYEPFIQLINSFNLKNIANNKNPFSKASETDAKNNNKILDTEALYSIQDRHSLIQQHIVSAIVENSIDKPLVVTFENIFYASQTIWQFIHYLAQKISDQKILLLASLRQDGRALAKNKIPVYADVLQRMNRDGLIKKITLDRLTLEDVRALVNSIYKQSDFSADFLPFLNEISDGIPKKVIMYLELFQKDHIVFVENGIWFNKENIDQEKLVHNVLEKTKLPINLNSVSQLSPEHRTLLNYASLLNYQFDHNILHVITKTPKIKVFQGFKYLKEEKYLHSVDDEYFKFKNNEVQMACADQIPSDQKQKMHLRIANAVENIKNLDPKKKVSLLASHYNASNDKIKAFEYLVKAGDMALKHLAFLEAKEFFQKSLELEKYISLAKSKSQIVHLHFQSAWLNRVLGNYRESVDNCISALNYHGKHKKDNTTNQILIQQSYTYFRLNDWENAKICLELCLKNQKNLTPFEKSMTNYGIGNIYFELCDYDESYNYYSEALRIAQEINSNPLIALILTNLGALENVRGNAMKAIELYSRAIPIYEELANNAGLARIYHNIGITYSDEEDWKKSNEFYGKSLSFSDKMGLMPLKSINFLNRALAFTNLDNLDEAKEYNYKAKRLLTKLNDQLGLAEYYKIAGIIETKEENLDKARISFKKALDIFNKYNNKLGCAETEYEVGKLAKKSGESQQYITWLKKSQKNYMDMGIVKKVEFIGKELESIKSKKIRSEQVLY